MFLLLNTTKTMNLDAAVPNTIKVTQPTFMEMSEILADKIAGLSTAHLAELMSLSDKLAIKTKKDAIQWGAPNRQKLPALFCFSGPLYKSFDALSLKEVQLNASQKKVRILSGLYGLLRPLDLIEAYRLEMGLKLAIGKKKNIAEYWRDTLTAKLNEELMPGEPIVSVASQEYMKALDFKKLHGPVILPIFKEKKPDGTYKNAAVHSKKARGELMRYALVNNIKTPGNLKGFNVMGWKSAQSIPDSGPWLFTRPAGK